jgi:hypothetical protein
MSASCLQIVFTLLEQLSEQISGTAFQSINRLHFETEFPSAFSEAATTV